MVPTGAGKAVGKEEKVAVEEEKAMNSLDSLERICKNLSDHHHLSNMRTCPEMTLHHKKRYLVKYLLPCHSTLILSLIHI